jgi:hypothetical protein
MGIVVRSAFIGAMLLAPSAALAWFPFQPALPEEAAREIAFQNGVVMIDDVDRTLDADWKIEGHDTWGNEVEIVIDGQTGAVERAEMEAN